MGLGDWRRKLELSLLVGNESFACSGLVIRKEKAEIRLTITRLSDTILDPKWRAMVRVNLHRSDQKYGLQVTDINNHIDSDMIVRQ